MVRVMNIDKNTIQELSAKKRVICFGSGRRFEYFRKNNPEIPIAGIIDNYKNIDSLNIDNKQIPLWFPEEISCPIDRNTIIIITSIAVEEIVDQMDKLEKFDGVPCYVEAVLDDYNGLEARQRLRLEKLYSRLVYRNKKSVLKENYGEANQVSDVKRCQIWEYISTSDTAGSKARTDIKRIIGTMGYQVVNLPCYSRDKGTFTAERSDRLAKAEWTYFFDMLPEYSIVFMQYPAPLGMRFPKDMILRMKKQMHIWFICLIHDVDSLRKMDICQMQQEEFELTKEISDFLIVHNNVMKEYFEKSGFEKDRIVTLDIFDYLHDEEENDKTFDKTIIFAGNLSREKSPFLDRIGKLSPLNIRLYGPDFSEDILSKTDHIGYCGSYPAEILPQKFDRGFGLVWDGNSLDTCAGGTGDYLRYNNPHKMSLYLSAGLPVIIWSGAAQAEFVKEKQVGIAVDSLYDIKDVLDGMDKDRYLAMAENAKKLSLSLRNGYFTRTAVQKIENMIKNSKPD